MSAIVKYVSSSYNELKHHVTWTSASESQRHTVTVVLFTAVFALLIYGIDSIFGEVISSFYKGINSGL